MYEIIMCRGKKLERKQKNGCGVSRGYMGANISQNLFKIVKRFKKGNEFAVLKISHMRHDFGKP
jgi:D-mannonate dehydratase